MNFAQRYTNYLRQHPFLNIGLIIAYYLAVVLPHEVVGIWIAQTLDQPFGRDTYNLIILLMGVSGFLAYLYLIWKGTNARVDKGKKTWLYLLITLVLIVLIFNTILVVNVEIIHFVQYAVLALLLFPICSSYQTVLFFATVLGAIDEAYQYLVLAPQRTDYYDFNDVLIDMIGATLGLFLLAAYGVKSKNEPTTFYKDTSFKGIVGISILALIALGMGWMTIHLPVDGSTTYFTLIKKMSTDFWTIIHPNVKFHVVRPLEWLILTICLWIFYKDIGL